MSDRPHIDLREADTEPRATTSTDAHRAAERPRPNVERDLERLLAAQTARAQVEARRILHTALEQAATLQAEMSREVEAHTRRRMETAEREIAERLAAADQEAEERVRQSVDTAASLLLNAHKEADRVRAQLGEAMRVQTEALRAELTSRPAPSVRPPVDDTALQAAERERAELARAEREVAEQRERAEREVAEQLAEAEAEAQAIVDRARAEAAEIAARAAAPEVAPREEAHDLAPEPTTDTRPPPPEPPRRTPPAVVAKRVLVCVVAAVVATLLVRAFVVEPYQVASVSMEPTLGEGDRVLVNKLAYRFGDLRRGDVVVIDTGGIPGAGDAEGESVVKRVVGMPGEVVRATGGTVIVNDEQIDEPWLGDVPTPDFGPVTVPDDAVFVLGDARLRSTDSREFGPVPIDAVQGRVDAVIWPLGDAGGV